MGCCRHSSVVVDVEEPVSGRRRSNSEFPRSPQLPVGNLYEEANALVEKVAFTRCAFLGGSYQKGSAPERRR